MQKIQKFHFRYDKYIKISYIYTVTFLTEISSCFTVSDLAAATIV